MYALERVTVRTTSFWDLMGVRAVINKLPVALFVIDEGWA